MSSIANLVLSGSYERVHHPASCTYADIPRGVFLVRGENVVLMGEVVRFVFVSERTCGRAELVTRMEADDRLSSFGRFLYFVDCQSNHQDLDVEDEPPIRMDPAPVPQVLALTKADAVRPGPLDPSSLSQSVSSPLSSLEPNLVPLTRIMTAVHRPRRPSRTRQRTASSTSSGSRRT